MMKAELAKLSNDFYRYGAEGKKLLAWHSIGQFFEAAEGTNPSVARMHLEYSKNSVSLDAIGDYFEGQIHNGSMEKIIINIEDLTEKLSKNSRFQELNKLIKEMYTQSYKKRLAILSNLKDNSVSGMTSVNINKKEKVREYIIRKLMFWT